MTDTPPKKPSAWNNHLVPLIPIVLALLVAVAVHLYARGHPMFRPHGHDGRGAATHPVTEPAVGLRVGAHAPRFRLSDARGGTVSLEETLERGQVLIVFYLGYDCDACVKNLRRIESEHDLLSRAGVRVLAISPDSAAHSAERQKESGFFPFPLLSDADRNAATAYDVYRAPAADYHGAFLIDRTGVIRFAYTGEHPFEDTDGLLRAARETR